MILNYFKNNLIMFLTLFILLGIFLYGLFFIGIRYLENKSKIKNVSSLEAKALLEKDAGIVVVDIRTAEEYSRGHLKGAINIDYYSTDFNALIGKLNKDTTYLIYCRTGKRSNKAMAILKKSGFKDILHLYSGILEWQRLGLPLEKKETDEKKNIVSMHS